MTDATKPLDISKAYVPEEERVLDPTLIETSIIDRLPQPTGWRVLILPFKPSRRSKGVILLIFRFGPFYPLQCLLLALI